ncbi:hypothetical protein [Chitinophaga pinensis]|uniref:hypothetical protein n=1 Tax=Chitinophaga pinensis TaxID=79329 RepID=UPI00019E3FB4|nr:hypothetical protein [Chitinophaga pinensis]
MLIEVIATMEDPQYIRLQQDHLTAIAKMKAMEKEYDRQKELNNSTATGDKVYKQKLITIVIKTL